MSRRTFVIRRVIGAVLLAPFVLFTVVVSCGSPGKAEEDLPDTSITNHQVMTDVILNADRFPNFAHSCWDTVGFWSTTDRVTIIVYNDWRCPGSFREQPMVVLSGNPRDILSSGS